MTSFPPPPGTGRGRTGRAGYQVPTDYCLKCQRQVWQTNAGWRHAASGMLACPPDKRNPRPGMTAAPRGLTATSGGASSGHAPPG